MNDPISVQELVLEGERQFTQGKTMEAIECFKAVLTQDPENTTALNNLGVIAYQLHDHRMAEEFLLKALRLNRRDSESLRNLVELYLGQGVLQKALPYLSDAAARELLSPDLYARFPDLQPTPATEKAGWETILSPKKILLINNLFPPQELGGYGRKMADYANLLRQRGHVVEVLTSNTRSLGEAPGPEPHVRRLLKLFGEWNNQGMVEYPRDRILTVIKENEQILQAVLDEFQPDLCLAGNIDLLSVLIFHPVLALGIPVFHSLGNEFIGYHAHDTPRNGLYYVIAPSQWLKDDAIRRGYPFQNALVVFDGAFTEEFQMLLPPATDRLRIAYAGLVNGYKGPQVLVEALHILLQNKIPFCCTLAGGTFDRTFVESLKNRVHVLGLSERIIFAGHLDREQLKNMFARHNIMVFPSLVPETFGISQVEAMAAGLLVISSATGGAKEVIEDGRSGLFFKPGDYSRLAAHLAFLLQKREKWERLALAGRERALERFNIQRSVDKLETAFADCLNIQKPKSFLAGSS